jgi:hypothetical protein
MSFNIAAPLHIAEPLHIAVLLIIAAPLGVVGTCDTLHRSTV